jgi:putative ABC transport system permease protein
MFPDRYSVSLLSFKETFPSGIQEQLWILFGAVGLLLLIACLNVSNLLLSKAAARAKEVAVRVSLGATRLRVIRQLLVESLLLALAGGVAGTVFAYVGLKGIIAMVPPGMIPDEAEIAINVPVLLFAVNTCVFSALLFGTAPALNLAGQNPIVPLRQSGRGNSPGRRQQVVRSGLIAGEVALSLMLLVGASLMARTLAKITSLDLPVRPDQILTMQVPLADQRYPSPERRVAFMRELLERVNHLPGVSGVAVNTGIHPLGAWSMQVETPGAPHPDSHRVLVNQCNESYTKVMSIPLVQGRFLSETAVANSLHEAVVNQSFADRYYEGKNVLGRMVRLPRLRSAPFNVKDDAFEIVGVVRNTLNNVGEKEEFLPEMYFPYTVTGATGWLIIAAQNPDAVAKSVRTQVYALDAGQPVMRERTLEAYLQEWVYSRPKFSLLLFGIFAGFGLVLALLGIYGVISHGVSQRTQEIGVRMALGARVADVVAMILWKGAALVGVGILAGLAASFASARVLASQVFRLSTFDPVSFTAVSLLLFSAGDAGVPDTRSSRRPRRPCDRATVRITGSTHPETRAEIRVSNSSKVNGFSRKCSGFMFFLSRTPACSE